MVKNSLFIHPIGYNLKMLPIIDGHNDVLLRLLQGNPPDARAFFGESQQGQFDFPRAKRGGLAGGFFAIFPPYPKRSPEGDPLRVLAQTWGENP